MKWKTKKNKVWQLCYTYECMRYDISLDPRVSEACRLDYWRLLNKFPAYEMSTG